MVDRGSKVSVSFRQGCVEGYTTAAQGRGSGLKGARKELRRKKSGPVVPRRKDKNKKQEKKRKEKEKIEKKKDKQMLIIGAPLTVLGAP